MLGVIMLRAGRLCGNICTIWVTCNKESFMHVKCWHTELTKYRNRLAFLFIPSRQMIKTIPSLLSIHSKRAILFNIINMDHIPSKLLNRHFICKVGGHKVPIVWCIHPSTDPTLPYTPGHSCSVHPPADHSLQHTTYSRVGGIRIHFHFSIVYPPIYR